MNRPLKKLLYEVRALEEKIKGAKNEISNIELGLVTKEEYLDDLMAEYNEYNSALGLLLEKSSMTLADIEKDHD